jgi:hypothetical protein
VSARPYRDTIRSTSWLDSTHVAGARRASVSSMTSRSCAHPALVAVGQRAPGPVDLVDVVRVPGDVSVVGYDDSWLLNCTDPPLTTVRQPIESMGKAAVALLVNQMESVSGYPETLLFEPELVVRGSTGPAPNQPLPADIDPLQQEFSAG